MAQEPRWQTPDRGLPAYHARSPSQPATPLPKTAANAPYRARQDHGPVARGSLGGACSSTHPSPGCALDLRGISRADRTCLPFARAQTAHRAHLVARPQWAPQTDGLDIDNIADWAVVKNVAIQGADPALVIHMSAYTVDPRMEYLSNRSLLDPHSLADRNMGLSRLRLSSDGHPYLVDPMEDATYRALDFMSREPPAGNPTGLGTPMEFTTTVEKDFEYGRGWQ